MNTSDWNGQAARIGALLREPLSPKRFIAAIQLELNCSGNHARNVLAAADGRFVTYQEGLWRKRS